MSKEPIQPQDKYVLRLPDGMRDRIKAAAEANSRSMNAEMVARLEQSFDVDKHLAELTVRAVRAETASDTLFTVNQFLAGMLASASGNEKEAMQLVAKAIRALRDDKSDDRGQLDKARESVIERLAGSMILANELGLDKKGYGLIPPEGEQFANAPKSLDDLLKGGKRQHGDPNK